MDLETTLLELEQSFWRAAGDCKRYAKMLASDAVHVFPGGGIAERQAVLDGVAHAEPWESVKIHDARIVALGDESAALVYSAHARRAEQPLYRAAITSVYRRRSDGWQLVVHQQTRLAP
jgi:hypothetical protein